MNNSNIDKINKTTLEKLKLIEKNTQELLGKEILIKTIENKKEPVVYIGTAITGKPHIGYFAWVTKLADFLDAGFKVKVLLADLHGALDNSPWDLLEKRYEYYTIVIRAMFKALGFEKNIEIIRGSDYQLSREYIYDIFKMSTIASIRDTLKATSDIVKQSESPKVSGLIYAIMQSLDEVYLDADIQMGGNDQRKVFVFAQENLPKIGYKKRAHLLLPLIPSFNQSGKMSSSDKNSKIDLIDDEKTVEKKMKKAYCPEAQIENNGVILFLKNIIFEIKQRAKEPFIIERPEKWGGNLSYNNYEDFEKDYLDKKIHPFDVKMAISKEINKLLKNIRKEFEGKEELIKKAYPEK